MLSHFRERLAAARAGDGVELEQGIIRIVNMAVVYVYLFGFFFFGDLGEHGPLILFAIGPAAILAALCLIGWMLARPGVNQMRRRTGSVLDMGSSALIMSLTGEVGTVQYPFFLWVIIGNGDSSRCWSSTGTGTSTSFWERRSFSGWWRSRSMSRCSCPA